MPIILCWKTSALVTVLINGSFAKEIKVAWLYWESGQQVSTRVGIWVAGATGWQEYQLLSPLPLHSRCKENCEILGRTKERRVEFRNSLAVASSAFGYSHCHRAAADRQQQWAGFQTAQFICPVSNTWLFHRILSRIMACPLYICDIQIWKKTLFIKQCSFCSCLALIKSLGRMQRPKQE